jgi:hypothetical protein
MVIFLTQNGWQPHVTLRKQNLVGKIGSSKRLNEQKSQRCGLTFNRAWRKLAITEQMNLILAEMIGSKSIGQLVELSGELLRSCPPQQQDPPRQRSPQRFEAK